MPHDLEYPERNGVADWASLYRARGTEAEPHRPVFTGDVFDKIKVQGIEETKNKSIMVVQHPCALRTNGVDLQQRLTVAEVRTHSLIAAEDWVKHVSKMPLPELIPTVTSGKRNQAAFLDEIYLASPDNLFSLSRQALRPGRWLTTNAERGEWPASLSGRCSPTLAGGWRPNDEPYAVRPGAVAPSVSLTWSSPPVGPRTGQPHVPVSPHKASPHCPGST